MSDETSYTPGGGALPPEIAERFRRVNEALKAVHQANVPELANVPLRSAAVDLDALCREMVRLYEKPPDTGDEREKAIRGLAEADLDLDAIEARASAAHPPPWELPPEDEREPHHYHRVTLSGTDAVFAARAREDVPRLVASVRALQAARRVEEVRAAWMMQRAIARDLARSGDALRTALRAGGDPGRAAANIAMAFAASAVVAASHGELGGKTREQRLELFGEPDPVGEPMPPKTSDEPRSS